MQKNKTCLFCGMFDHLDCPSKGCFDPIGKITGMVTTIGQEFVNPWMLAGDIGQEIFRAVAFTDIRRMHANMHNISLGIDQDMTFATLNLFFPRQNPVRRRLRSF